jgi:hypothetical protein
MRNSQGEYALRSPKRLQRGPNPEFSWISSYPTRFEIRVPFAFK